MTRITTSDTRASYTFIAQDHTDGPRRANEKKRPVVPLRAPQSRIRNRKRWAGVEDEHRGVD